MDRPIDADESLRPTSGNITSEPFPEVLSSCEYSFQVSQMVEGPILLYYQLENYYQNHRVFVKSVEPKQLQGEALTYSQLSLCAPLQGPPGFDEMGDSRPVYYPCGLIANALFNGTPSHFLIF